MTDRQTVSDTYGTDRQTDIQTDRQSVSEFYLACATAERWEEGVMALKAERKSVRETLTVAGSTSSLSWVS